MNVLKYNPLPPVHSTGFVGEPKSALSDIVKVYSQSVRSETRVGLIFALAAQIIWGLFPLYFPLALPSSPLEILAFRIIFSMLTCLLLLTAARALKGFFALWKQPKVILITGVASLLIATNWLVYIYATTTGQVLDAALGYFINPIVTALLGVIVLKERMRPMQWAGLALGVSAVFVIIFGYGKFPWIAITIALSFGLYGLVKKQLGANISALGGLTLETALILPIAFGYAMWLLATREATFPFHGTGHTLAIIGLGVITAIPLLFFSAAARRLPLTVLSFVQYVGPILQFLVGYLIIKEEMPSTRFAGFILIWVALGCISFDAWRQNRQAQRLLKASR